MMKHKNFKKMKTTILALLLTISSFSQDNESSLNLLQLDSTTITFGYTAGYTFRSINIDSIYAEYEKAYKLQRKSELLDIMKEYFDTDEEIIIGYNFIYSSSSEMVLGSTYYLLAAREYYYFDNSYSNIIHEDFEDREKGAEMLKDKRFARIVTYNLDSSYIDVKPIRVKKKKTLEGFYQWLSKDTTK